LETSQRNAVFHSGRIVSRPNYSNDLRPKIGQNILYVRKGWEFTGPKKSMGIDFDIDFSENCCKLQYKSNLHNFYKSL